jgi:transitional endoplasmic reticulum ATPase
MAESIHKGKAFSIQFFDADGDQIQIPTPKFFRFNNQQPIFRKDLEQAIDRNIFTPIRHAADLQAMGESLKRGVLFAGSYGTGKTMLASAIADVASQHNWTFIYVKDPQELPLALKYAQKFQPVVVFCEDVDRVAGSERSNEVNNLLNQLDGVDSKSAQIMTILTSNHSNRVNAAMRRPGRIDMVLQVLPPDAETIGRMVKAFVGEGLEHETNLDGIGTTLSGFAPAYIKEACGRARLEALRRTGNLKSLISGADLETVAQEVAAEKHMFTGPEDDQEAISDASTMAKGFEAASVVMNKALHNASKQRSKQSVQ